MASLFDTSGFPPRWQCGNWSPAHGWLHIASDVGIWAAYSAIPLVLAYYLLRRRLPFRGVQVLFILFILSCGLTHLIEAFIFWWPAYRLAGAVKFSTAVVSWLTVFALIRVTPKIMTLRASTELEAEIADRKRAESALRESEELFRHAFDDAAVGMALVAPDGRWLRVNAALCEMLGYDEAGLMATDFERISHPDDLGTDLEGVWGRLNENPEKYQRQKRYLHKSGRVVHVQLAVSLVRGATGEPQYFITQIIDVTARVAAKEQLRGSLREKETLLKEIHHRVKNNLQIVSTLLDLQSGHTTDAAAREMFRESRGRVRSMALIHERLYRTDDTARVEFADYARQLTADLGRAYKVPGDVDVVIEADETALPLDTAIPCGLLLNELVSNALKHAFPGGGPGEVRVSLKASGGRAVMTVADTGVGFPPGIDPRTTSSFGLQLVNTLAEQLSGTVARGGGPGTTFVVEFPTG